MVSLEMNGEKRRTFQRKNKHRYHQFNIISFDNMRLTYCVTNYVQNNLLEILIIYFNSKIIQPLNGITFNTI